VGPEYNALRTYGNRWRLVWCLKQEGVARMGTGAGQPHVYSSRWLCAGGACAG
jgi:hypothetical protein